MGKQVGDPVAAFAAQLRELRIAAGSPSFRQLSKITHYSSSALAEMTSGKRLPSEAILKAFAAGCGADPDEWLARLRAAAASAAQARSAATAPGRSGTVSSSRARRRLVIAACAGGLLAAGGLAGAAIQAGGRSDPPGRQAGPAAVKTSVKRAADGTDPVVAGCVKDARMVDKSPVMLHGRQIGALEMIYSASCRAGWARVYLYPGEPDMLGEATIRASDGRLSAFAYPLVKQVPVYTDVLAPGSGGCLGAAATVRPANSAPVVATITCQDPASRSSP